VIFGLGPYIADYPEQVLISCVVQNWCGHCLGYPDDLDGGGAPCTSELMEALCQEVSVKLVKGAFKDHLVEWVGKYLEIVYGKSGAKDQLADIDCDKIPLTPKSGNTPDGDP
ncbi:hypothetical protein OG21DRAFT_1428003, partial [Imleria badia]